MNPAVAELIDVLEQETALVKQLVEALQADQQRIIQQDIEALETSNQLKEELVVRLQVADRNRHAISHRLGSQLGIAPDQIRVSAICGKLGPAGQPLETAADTLRAAVGGLAELVAVSRGFLEQSIVGIRGLLSLIQGLASPSTQTYDSSGRFAQPQGEPEAMALRREV